MKVIVKQPLVATNTLDKFDIICNVKGGGISGQAGAIRHGIARALLQANSEYRPILKSSGFLTRDARMKERKKLSPEKKMNLFKEFFKEYFDIYNKMETESIEFNVGHMTYNLFNNKIDCIISYDSLLFSFTLI